MALRWSVAQTKVWARAKKRQSPDARCAAVGFRCRVGKRAKRERERESLVLEWMVWETKSRKKYVNGSKGEKAKSEVREKKGSCPYS